MKSLIVKNRATDQYDSRYFDVNSETVFGEQATLETLQTVKVHNVVSTKQKTEHLTNDGESFTVRTITCTLADGSIFDLQLFMDQA